LRATLVQVLALHMACDFCLSDYHTKKVIRNNTFKLVSVARPSVSAYIGVTYNADDPVKSWHWQHRVVYRR
jgi:hypothetical protein